MTGLRMAAQNFRQLPAKSTLLLFERGSNSYFPKFSNFITKFDSTVSEDAETVALFGFAVTRSNHSATSYPLGTLQPVNSTS